MARGAAIASSGFTGDESPLSESGNWTQLSDVDGNVIKVGGEVSGSTANECASRWSGAGSFTKSQWAKVVYKNTIGSSGRRLGVLLNASSDTNANRDYLACYFTTVLHGGSGANVTVTLAEVVNGTPSVLDTAASIPFAFGDSIEAEYDEATNTLTGFRNGSAIVGLSANPSAAGTAQPGVTAYSGVTGDDWEAGNVTAGGGGGKPWHHYASMMGN